MTELIHLDVEFVPFEGADSESRWWLAIGTLVDVLLNEGDDDVEVEERIFEGESAFGNALPGV